jgi:hypothetical protein
MLSIITLSITGLMALTQLIVLIIIVKKLTYLSCIADAIVEVGEKFVDKADDFIKVINNLEINR